MAVCLVQYVSGEQLEVYIIFLFEGLTCRCLCDFIVLFDVMVHFLLLFVFCHAEYGTNGTISMGIGIFQGCTGDE